MKITNKLNLPYPIYQACKNDDYDKGDADYSVTQLLKPAWMNNLAKKHSGELERDCSDMLWALMGSAMHKILEIDCKNYLQEKRLDYDVAGKIISGKIDLFDVDNSILYDYKFASVWEYIYGLKDEKIQQLNIYKFLLEENSDIDVNKLKIVFLFRDWSKTKAEHDSNYPQTQIAIVNVPTWEKEKTLNFIKSRIKAIEHPAPCTKDERWCRDEKWAVMKKGRKSAVKLFDNQKDAEKLKTESDNYYIEHRLGTNTRCMHYCDVSKFCEYKEK